MEHVRLVYATDELDEAELPLRFLVLGSFSKGKNRHGIQLNSLPTLSVTRKNFDSVLAQSDVQLDLSVDNHCRATEGGILDIHLHVCTMGGFTPGSIISMVPEIQSLLSLRDRLIGCTAAGDLLEAGSLNPKHLALFKSEGYEDQAYSPEICSCMAVGIEDRISRQLDAILHNEEFKRLESAWRGLEFLVGHLDPADPGIEVDFLDVSKAELEQDFDENLDITETVLYRKCYIEEFGQYGGKPYAAIIGNFELGYFAYDVKLLAKLSTVASLCHAPFIAGLAPSFWGEGGVSAIAGLESISAYVEDEVKLIKWRSLQATDNARYAGLTFPGFLLRQSYDERLGREYDFTYRESIFTLWGNSAFAFAANMVDSFTRYKLCLNITGPDDGRVTGLYSRVGNALSERARTIPVETAISEKKTAELARYGFIPLLVHKKEGYAFFDTANSVRTGGIEQSVNKKQDLDLLLAAKLPYTFVICRLAHYIKVIQRDSIGSSNSPEEQERKLNNWLIRYVSDMDNPAPAVKARRPLRKAKVEVAESSSTGYDMNLTITPHLTYLGASFSLSLQGQLGGK